MNVHSVQPTKLSKALAVTLLDLQASPFLKARQNQKYFYRHLLKKASGANLCTIL
jgi:hypothetical protein